MRKKIIILPIALSLFLTSCGSDTISKRYDELSQKYEYYPEFIKNIKKNMNVTPEQADEIFLTLIDCGISDTITKIMKNSDNTFSVWISLNEYTVSLEDGVTSKVIDNNFLGEDEQLYPVPQKTENEDDIKTETTPKPTPKPSKEDTIRLAIEDAIGADNLDTFNYVPDNNFSLIKFKGTENLTNKMTIKGMYLDMFNILKSIQPVINTSVDFNVVYPLIDEYGNKEDVIVIKATYKKKTIKKIIFDNVLWENTPNLADEWWNHAALNLTD